MFQGCVKKKFRKSHGNLFTFFLVSGIVFKVPPYLTRKNNGSQGNDAFEGFCKDLLDNLAKNLNFNYVLRLGDDPNIGELNKETGRYSGLIGELREFVISVYFWEHSSNFGKIL